MRFVHAGYFAAALFAVSLANGGDQASDAPGLGPFINSAGSKMLPVAAGTFEMGAGEDDEEAYPSEKPAHSVSITRLFYMGQTEVTQGQWRSVMKSEPWKGKPFIQEGPNYPATFINWKMAQQFCRTLSEREGRVYRLPTEAEWEFACRAGTRTAYSFGADVSQLTSHAWFEENSGLSDAGRPQPVGQKKPNALGLYDMHGNVREWCQDWYGDYVADGQTDPQGPETGQNRVFRGGCWNDADIDCRSSFRDYFQPNDRNYFLGFRLVAEVKQQP